MGQCIIVGPFSNIHCRRQGRYCHPPGVPRQKQEQKSGHTPPSAWLAICKGTLSIHRCPFARNPRISFHIPVHFAQQWKFCLQIGVQLVQLLEDRVLPTEQSLLAISPQNKKHPLQSLGQTWCLLYISTFFLSQTI